MQTAYDTLGIWLRQTRTFFYSAGLLSAILEGLA